MAENYNLERRRRAERTAQTMFLVSNILATLGFAVAAVGLILALVTGNTLVLWIGGLILAVGIVGSLFWLLKGIGIASIDVEEALAARKVRTPGAAEGEQTPE